MRGGGGRRKGPTCVPLSDAKDGSWGETKPSQQTPGNDKIESPRSLANALDLVLALPEHVDVFGPLADEEREGEDEVGLALLGRNVHKGLEDASGEALCRHIVVLLGGGYVGPEVEQEFKEAAGAGTAHGAERLLPEVDVMLRARAVGTTRGRGLPR